MLIGLVALAASDSGVPSVRLLAPRPPMEIIDLFRARGGGHRHEAQAGGALAIRIPPLCDRTRGSLAGFRTVVGGS